MIDLDMQHLVQVLVAVEHFDVDDGYILLCDYVDVSDATVAKVGYFIKKYGEMLCGI